MMCRSGLEVERTAPNVREAWLVIRRSAPPPRAAAAPPAKRPPTAARPAFTARPPSAQATPPAPPALPPPADGTATVIEPSPPGSTPPLDLRLPPDAWKSPAPLTPAQEAMRDPRSNTLRLTAAERLLLGLGGAECIAWQRLPDGSTWRGPGHFRDVPRLAARPDGTRVQECVR